MVAPVTQPMPPMPSPPAPDPRRPFWLPDTQGFLAIAIVMFMGTIVMFLLHSEPKFDDKTQGVLMVVLGVMTGCLKDVYSYFFGSSRGEEKKGDIISTIATQPTTPVVGAAAVGPALDQLAESMLTPDELAYFKTIGDDDGKRRFLSMSTAERIATIGKG